MCLEGRHFAPNDYLSVDPYPTLMIFPLFSGMFAAILHVISGPDHLAALVVNGQARVERQDTAGRALRLAERVARLSPAAPPSSSVPRSVLLP